MAHDSTVMAAVSLTAVAIAVATLYLRRRRRKFLTLPSTLGDKNGGAIVVRVAQVSDREEVASSIADQTGTGSGTGNDDFLLQEFNRMVNDDNFLLLFAEDAETAKGLGMMAVVWSSSTETYWQSLRVSEAARGRGIASRLFDVAAHMALQRQGAESVARWGVVSSNEIMTRWSTRLGLAGPQHFRRYGADATAEPPRLPAGYTQRGATEDDVPMIMAFLATAPVGHSEYGTQNFVMAGWASFSEELLRAAVAGEASRGIPVPPPRLLLDASGALVAFVHAAILQFGERRFFMFRYADGAKEPLELLLHCLPHLAHQHECVTCGGYIPVLPWLVDLFEASATFKRMTQTEQHEFHWKNKDFARPELIDEVAEHSDATEARPDRR